MYIYLHAMRLRSVTIPMIIDFHIHVGEVPIHFGEQFATEMMGAVGKSPSELSVDLDRLIHEMDTNGVDKAVLLAFDASWVGVRVTNQYVSRMCLLHPERFFGFASFDANTPITWEALEHAHRSLRLIGYKLAFGYQNVSPEHTGWRNLYLYASENKLPMLAHFGYTPISRVNMSYCMPKRLHAVCKEYPELRVVIAHMGWPWIQETFILLESYEHVYADLSVMAANLSTKQILDVLNQAKHRGVLHKLLWGSDYPIFTLNNTVSFLQGIRARTTQSGLLTQEQWDHIQYGNAYALLYKKN